MKRKFIISGIALLLALMMLVPSQKTQMPQTVQAASSSAIKQQIEELEAQKEQIDADIAELEGQLSENLSEMGNIYEQKVLLDQQIFALHQQVANVNDQIVVYIRLIDDKQTELDEAEAHLEELNIKNKARIRALEEGGDLSYWSVLFKSSNFSDFLDRLNMINEIAAADQRRLEEMAAVAEEIQIAKEELEVELEALEEAKIELEESKAALDEKIAEADALLLVLMETDEEYRQLLEEAESKADQLGSDIADAEEAYEEAKYQEWLSTSVPPTQRPVTGGTGGSSNNVGGKTWLVPCSYILFSSPYGYREHPVLGGTRFHTGVDLAGPSGTPIVATRDGVVTIAEYSPSRGYYVEIDHLDGYASQYLHFTHYIVSPGQSVTAGQVIGYMGSTGISTGSHLHFTIFYNGNHVNPANYINI